MLELEKLQKSYRKNEVLRDVSITVKDGESVCFVGANGAGKSTLLKIIVEHFFRSMSAMCHRKIRYLKI